MSIWSHSKAILSLFVITTNLALCCVPVLLLAIAKIVLPGLKRQIDTALEWIYRTAVGVHDFWLGKVLGLQWTKPHLGLSADANVIALSNHVSWTDVLLIQSIFVREGLILKFLTKRQLMFVPIFGIIFWAFDFPVLRRRASPGMSEEERRRRDREAIAAACSVHASRPGVLVNFAEGTRSTAEKRKAQASPFVHLLSPKVGGFASLLDALASESLRVVDLTLVYSEGHSFWRFLSGNSQSIEVIAEVVHPDQIPADRAGRAEWLEERWRRKDARIGDVSARAAGSR